jgi:predicted aconitase with swiveling domain
MDDVILHGKAFIPGGARGEALVSREPLSFWGGYDWKTGEIIDRRHPLGSIASGKILAIPFTAVHLQHCSAARSHSRRDCAEAISRPRWISSLRSPRSATELYDAPLPLVAISEADFARLRTGDLITIDDVGRVVVSRQVGG